jgi:hypothetical protein
MANFPKSFKATGDAKRVSLSSWRISAEGASRCGLVWDIFFTRANKDVIMQTGFSGHMGYSKGSDHGCLSKEVPTAELVTVAHSETKRMSAPLLGDAADAYQFGRIIVQGLRRPSAAPSGTLVGKYPIGGPMDIGDQGLLDVAARVWGVWFKRMRRVLVGSREMATVHCSMIYIGRFVGGGMRLRARHSFKKNRAKAPHPRRQVINLNCEQWTIFPFPLPVNRTTTNIGSCKPGIIIYVPETGSYCISG